MVPTLKTEFGVPQTDIRVVIIRHHPSRGLWRPNLGEVPDLLCHGVLLLLLPLYLRPVSLLVRSCQPVKKTHVCVFRSIRGYTYVCMNICTRSLPVLRLSRGSLQPTCRKYAYVFICMCMYIYTCVYKISTPDSLEPTPQSIINHNTMVLLQGLSYVIHAHTHTHTHTLHSLAPSSITIL
jgi:hypothetical protein